MLVLIASDGDFVPLVRKLNTLGTRVMILSWDFEFTNDMGKLMITRTSHDLIEEASYPIPMHDMIDDPKNRADSIISNLFVPGGETRRKKHFIENEDQKESDQGETPDTDIGEVLISEVLSLKNGYGFIKFPPNNLFFHFTSVKNLDFNDLLIGDKVEFTLKKNDEGQLIATNVNLVDDDNKILPPAFEEEE